MDERLDDQKLRKASLDGSGNVELGGSSDDVSLERIEKVYRRLDLRIIPGLSSQPPPNRRGTRLNVHSLLGTVLPLLSHPLQRWSRADDESRDTPHSGPSPQH